MYINIDSNFSLDDSWDHDIHFNYFCSNSSNSTSSNNTCQFKVPISAIRRKITTTFVSTESVHTKLPKLEVTVWWMMIHFHVIFFCRPFFYLTRCRFWWWPPPPLWYRRKPQTRMSIFCHRKKQDGLIATCPLPERASWKAMGWNKLPWFSMNPLPFQGPGFWWEKMLPRTCFLCFFLLWRWKKGGKSWQTVIWVKKNQKWWFCHD